MPRQARGDRSGLRDQGKIACGMRAATLILDRRTNYRSCQAWAPSVRFHPLVLQAHNIRDYVGAFVGLEHKVRHEKVVLPQEPAQPAG